MSVPSPSVSIAPPSSTTRGSMGVTLSCFAIARDTTASASQGGYLPPHAFHSQQTARGRWLWEASRGTRNTGPVSRIHESLVGISTNATLAASASDDRGAASTSREPMICTGS